jgi:SepF-like predicted cell division protein (DUF552 family)
MMQKFLDRLIGRPAEGEYVEVDLGQFDDLPEEAPQTYLRMAELSSMEALPEVKKEIYAGSIQLMDISPIKRDKAALDRAIGELRKTVEDAGGDIAGIGDDLVVMVPKGIKIDRERIIGGRG